MNNPPDETPATNAPRAAAGAPAARPVALITFLALFALLLASFPARNGDVWMHLASGRELARGSFTPVVVSPEQRPHATWLADILFYLAHAAGGGQGLVAAKALLTVALALLLFSKSWADGDPWAPALATALALLAMSTRLLLQSATFSYLILGVALACGPWARRARGPWLVLLIFLIWVNLDTWFVVGLGVVALGWLGEGLDVEQGRGRAVLVRAAWSLLLVLTCLLSPSLTAALALPADVRLIGVAGSPASLLAAGAVVSPFSPSYLSTLGPTPAALAYFVLLGLSALSFLLNLPRWRWRWALPWLGVAALSAVQARAIPFFAVVAGPVLAWNLQEAIAARPGAVRPDRLRILAGALAVLLLVCAWPGYLQAPPYEPRRWAVEPAPALRQAAEEAPAWRRRAGLAEGGRGLHLSAESAFAFAWYRPEDRPLFDERLNAGLFGLSDRAMDWPGRLREAGVDHVVVHHPDRQRLLAAVNRLVNDPGQWALLHVRGDVAFFGWRGAAAPFTGPPLDLNELAFQPASAARAPAAGPDEEGQRRWFAAFVTAAPARSIDRDEATMFLALADAARPAAPRRHLQTWEAGQVAGLVGGAAGWGGVADATDAAARLALFRPPMSGRPGERPGALSRAIESRQRQFARESDDSPTAALYLAVRAARRAVAATPADARAFLILGECYLRLARNTRERAWSERMPELGAIRRAQATAALHQALALQPDLAPAHLSLGAVYAEAEYLDLALRHQTRYLELVRAAGPPAGVDRAAFAEELAGAQESLERLGAEVARREAAYGEEASGVRVLDRAQAALRLGLAGKALETLLASHVSAFGARGVSVQLNLMLQTGRARDVRDWAGEDLKAALGEDAFSWLRAQAHAAMGDYAAARQELARLATGGRRPGEEGPRELTARTAGQAVLDGAVASRGLAELLLAGRQLDATGRRLAGLLRAMRQEADANALAGLLALEQGDVKAAEGAFLAAMSHFGSPEAVAAGAAIDFSGRPIAQQGLNWLPAQ